MKQGRFYTDYLGDMQDACIKAVEFVQGMSFEEFMEDEKTQFAVIRALEIVGEASKKIPQTFKDENPNIGRRSSFTYLVPKGYPEELRK